MPDTPVNKTAQGRTIKQRFDNAYLLLTLTALFWAGNFTVGRGVHENIPPITLSWLRWTGALAIILPFALPHLRKDWQTIRQHLPIIVFFGVMGPGLFNSLQYIALNHTLALNAMIINSSGPVAIVLAGLILFRDRISAVQLVGIAISLIGVLVVVSQGNYDQLTMIEFNGGDLVMLLAMMVWAIYTNFLRKRPQMHGLSFAAATFLVASFANLPFAAGEYLGGRQIFFDRTTLFAVIYVAIFPSILGYLFFNRGVELIGSSRAGVFLHLVPLFGSLLAVFVLGERLQGYHIIGLALILAGVALAARKSIS